MDWQPIETAPKDGTAVLLWGPLMNRACAGWYHVEDEEWRTDVGEYTSGDVTHWMHLPNPPKVNK